jgi:L-ascorbate metabolism protein UlaG (beta-lactamase superfamily)
VLEDLSDKEARCNPTQPDPSAVSVQWLGTASFRVEYQGHVVLIDPYMTRSSVGSLLLAPIRPNEDVLARELPRANAIVVGHTHFDHASDVPALARRTGADVFGSFSAARLCLSQGVTPARVHIVEQCVDDAVRTGPFRIRFLPSRHGPFLAGTVPFPGGIDSARAPMRMQQYRSGTVFVLELEVGGRRLVHLGSAELPTCGTAWAADLLMLCSAGWRAAHQLPERVVERYRPATVLLSHWDNFFRPLSLPAQRLPGMALERLAERLRAAPGDRRVGVVPLRGQLTL